MLLLYYLLNWIFYKVGRFHKIVYIKKSHFLIISNLIKETVKLAFKGKTALSLMSSVTCTSAC